MQEAPKELLQEIKAISNANLLLSSENQKLQLEVESLRKLLHDCTCAVQKVSNDRELLPMEKL